MAFYGTVEAVLEDSGIKPEDLGFKPDETITADEKLKTKIENWLTFAKDYIDKDRKRDFSDDTPICITSIAVRIAVNFAKQAKLNRALNIIDTDNFKAVVTEDTILTQSILNDLERCAPLTVEGSSVGFTIMTLYDPDKMAEDES